MQQVQVVDLKLDSGDDRTSVYQGDVSQIMRVRLQPGEALPPHNANADAVLIPLAGKLRFANDGGEHTWTVGQALAVPYDTPMLVSNAGDESAVFLLVKTPPKS